MVGEGGLRGRAAAGPDDAAAPTPRPASSRAGEPDGTGSHLPAPTPAFWSGRSVWRRAALVVQVLAGTLSAMMLLLAVGMFRNDMAIDDNPVRATATVLTVSATSTGIEFVDNQGVSQRPPGGVLYPGGLSVGQQFLVEYDATDPTLVRVAGRSAVNGVIMPGYVLVGTWLAAAGVLWWLGPPGPPGTVGSGGRAGCRPPTT